MSLFGREAKETIWTMIEREFSQNMVHTFRSCIQRMIEYFDSVNIKAHIFGILAKNFTRNCHNQRNRHEIKI